MTDKRTIDVYNARAGDYAQHFTGPPSDDLRTFTAALPPGATVLDLGCGPGNAAAYMADQGHEAHAWDASPAMIALAARHPKVQAKEAAFEDLTQTAAFDGIWASFSLLHAPRTSFPGHLAAIHRALKPGGLLFLGMKLGTGEGPDAMGRFYTYYEESDLLTHLAAEGFTVTAQRTGREVGLSGSNDPFMVLHAHA